MRGPAAWTAAVWLCLVRAASGAHAGPPGPAEVLSSTDIASTLSLAFRVDETALQALLPAPWKLHPPTQGPFRGANLTINFLDWLRNEDAQGRPKTDNPERYVAISAPARHADTGEQASMVLHGYRTRTVLPHFYKTHLPAAIFVSMRVESEEPGAVQAAQEWRVREPGGGLLLHLRLRFRPLITARARARGEARIRSGVDPALQRTYRFDSVSDVVRSVPDGIDRVTDYRFRIRVPRLQALFGGSPPLVGIRASPWYMRQVFLPQP